MNEWTTFEERFLEKNINNFSNKELAEKLDRTIGSVAYKLRDLNITRNKDVELFNKQLNEQWKIIKTLPNYSISNFGRIKNNNTNVIRKTNLNKDGYVRVTLTNNKSYYIHQLVALCFIPNRNNLPQVNHIDGNKQNNTKK